MQQQRLQQPPTTPSKSRPPPPQPHPQRITQLQCLDTNSELQQFFIQSISESLKYLPNILSKIYDEIQLFVGLVQFRLTIAIGNPHPGDSLQNLEYRKSSIGRKSVLVGYFVLSVVLPYVKRKIYGWLMRDPTGWKDKVIRLFNLIDKILMVLNLINSSIFIKNGYYRTLSQRIVGIPMQFITGESARVLNFGLMNRKIIWRVYQLFLRTILPFANDIFGSTLKNIFYLKSYLEVSQDKQNKCIFCEQLVKMPMKSECGHMACYFCYKENEEDQEPQKGKAKRMCKNCGAETGVWKKMF